MAAIDEDQVGYHIRNGYALILNHTTFDNKKVHARPDIKKDVLNLQTTLERLHFTVDLIQDGTHDTIMRKIQTVASDKELKECDCLMVVIMTHGNTFGQLLSKTSQYFINELMEHFAEEAECPSGLNHVPKVFLIQACHFTGNNLVPPAQLDDVLLLHSTIEGCELVQSICKALQSNHLYRTDLHTIIRRINDELLNLGTESGNIDNTLRQRLYFECSAQPNCQSHFKYVQDSLFFAAKRDNIEMFIYQLKIMKQIIVDDADFNVFNSEGESLLFIAVKIQCIDGVKMLVERGVDPCTRNQDGNTPLRYAHKAGMAMVKLILTKKALTIENINAGLLQAVSCGHHRIARYALQNGANTEIGNSYKVLPLNLAVSQGHCDIVKILLMYGAKVNAFSGDGYTALHIAARKGDFIIVDILLRQKGIDVNAKTKKQGHTPLHWAAMNRSKHAIIIIAQLLAAGANMYELDNNSNTALKLAIHWNLEENIKYLEHCINFPLS